MRHGIARLKDGPGLTVQFKNLRNDPVITTNLLGKSVNGNEPDKAACRVLRVLPAEIVDIHIHSETVFHQRNKKFEIVRPDPFQVIGEIFRPFQVFVGLFRHSFSAVYEIVPSEAPFEERVHPLN